MNSRTRPCALLIATLAALLALACQKSPSPPPSEAEVRATKDPSEPSRIEETIALDATKRDGTCALGHLGTLIDFGEPGVATAPEHDGLVPSERLEHDGATWERVRSRTLSARFLWGLGELDGAKDNMGDGATSDIRVRIVDGGAHSLSVIINGKVVGAAPLHKGPAKILTIHTDRLPLIAGVNELSIQFHGGARNSNDVQADVDWVDIGAGDPNDDAVAPSWADSMMSPSLGGMTHRAIALAAPSYLRCVGWIPRGGVVRVALGVAGTGSGDVVIKLLRDHAAPLVVSEEHVTGGPKSEWKSVAARIPSSWVGTLGAIEFDAVRGPEGGRILLGEPRIVTSEEPREPAGPKVAARGVVLVVLGGTSRATLAPYGGPRPVPELSQLAHDGVTFTEHRALSLFANATLASMFTGTSPNTNGVVAFDTPFPPTLTTVAGAARQAGIATAMFTANPLTTSAFGFNRDWETFVERSPAEPGHAAGVFDDATAWIDSHRKDPFLVVIHARGGHPPWDIPSAKLPALPPLDYAGIVEPRHIAELVSRAKHFPTKFTDDDRTRAWAFYANAIDEHDAALGRVMSELRSIGRDDGTMVIVTGDVGIEGTAPMPFGETDALDEGRLAIPLIVRPAKKSPHAESYSVPTSSDDIAKTILRAFGLSAPTTFGGTDLLSLGEATAEQVVHADLASVPPRFAARWGAFVLEGRGREMRLCDRAIDPECALDARLTAPLALVSLMGFLESARPPNQTAAASEFTPRAPATTAGLAIWGLPVHVPAGRR